MRRLGIPRRTTALIGANSLCAAVQGQFQFVLPWMLLSRGHSPQVAALAAGLVYVPLLVTAVPAGMAADNADPRKVMRWATGITLVACSLYPLAALAGHDWFGLVLVAAFVVGTTRNFSEGALFRAMGDTTKGGGLLRAHAVRTTVNQAAVFGSPFFGLLLFRFGGGTAVLVGVCLLLATALAILAVVPELERGTESTAVMFRNVALGMASLRSNRRLRKIGWVNLSWNVFAGAAIGMMPAIFREHLGMNEVSAGATFIAGAVIVIVLTLPVVRSAQRHLGAIMTFIFAITIQGLAVILFAPGAAILGPVVYCVFLLSNSAAAASLNGARATEVEHDHQGLLNMALLTVGMIGFIAGVVLAAELVSHLGFALLLVVIGLGMTATAAGFRKPLVAG